MPPYIVPLEIPFKTTPRRCTIVSSAAPLAWDFFFGFAMRLRTTRQKNLRNQSRIHQEHKCFHDRQVRLARLKP